MSEIADVLARALQLVRRSDPENAEDLVQEAALRALQGGRREDFEELFWRHLRRRRGGFGLSLRGEPEGFGQTPEDTIMRAEVENELEELRAHLERHIRAFCERNGNYRWFRIIQELLALAEDPVQALLAVHGFLFPRECPHRPGERKVVSALLRRQLGLKRSVFDVHVFRARRAWKALIAELRSDPDLSRTLRSSTRCPRPSVLAALRARRRPAPRH